MNESSPSTTPYCVVFAALVVLTLATVGLSFCQLGNWHTVIGLAIAAIKAALVALFFMHLLHSQRLTWLALGAGLFWLAILMSLTLADYLTRNWLAY
jgi:cytochrome c oxidase subunit IV